MFKSDTLPKQGRGGGGYSQYVKANGNLFKKEEQKSKLTADKLKINHRM